MNPKLQHHDYDLATLGSWFMHDQQKACLVNNTFDRKPRLAELMQLAEASCQRRQAVVNQLSCAFNPLPKIIDVFLSTIKDCNCKSN